MKKAYLNWSSGKDAMLALHRIHTKRELKIEKLVTTINSDFDRVSMHGIPAKLLVQQATNLEISLHQIPLKGEVSLEMYTNQMQEHTVQLKAEGFETAAFGDIFLEDLVDYRKAQLQKIDLDWCFPLWKEDTHQLAKEFIDLGYKAIVVCTNEKVLDESFCGRIFDKKFLNDLPKSVDPCGENGEFHTFVFDGPLFKKPVNFEIEGKCLRDFSPNKKGEKDCFDTPRSWDTKFWFLDLKWVV